MEVRGLWNLEILLFWLHFSRYYQESSLHFSLSIGDLHSHSVSFYWNPQWWISSFLFFCLQIHLFKICVALIWVCSCSESGCFGFTSCRERGNVSVLQPLKSGTFIKSGPVGIHPHTPFCLQKRFVSLCYLFANSYWQTLKCTLGHIYKRKVLVGHFVWHASIS